MATPSASALTNEEELYWLALRMVPGLGTRRIGLLLERLRTPQAIFRASASELEAAGLTGAVARSVAGGSSFEDAASQQQKAREAGAQLITLNDARYPETLRKIFDPPRSCLSGDAPSCAVHCELTLMDVVFDVTPPTPTTKG